MSKVAVVYYSYKGVTEKMVQALKKGVDEAGGKCTILSADTATPEDLGAADTVVFASGQPFGTIAGPLKTFIEKLWASTAREQLSGKKFVTLINGNRDPKDSSDYLQNILTYFKLEKAAEGISCLAENIDTALDKCEKLGKQLA
ncbi:MAG: hypothetical protein M1365_05690 [Actinobacteria bacterium]|nr:hypothetical protein [Actinomycetota bacterium]